MIGQKTKQETLNLLFEVYNQLDGTHIYDVDHSIYRYKLSLENKLGNVQIALHYPDGSLADIRATAQQAYVKMRDAKVANPCLI